MTSVDVFSYFISILLGLAVGTALYSFYRVYVMNRTHKLLTELEDEYKYLQADLYMKFHSGTIEEEIYIQKIHWLGQLYTTLALDIHASKGKIYRKERAQIK